MIAEPTIQNFAPAVERRAESCTPCTDLTPPVHSPLSLAELPPVGGPTPRSLVERNQRLAVLGAVRAALAQQVGCSEAAACRLVGVDQSTYSRWRDAHEASGADGLVPRRHKAGRKSALEKFGLSPELLDKIRALALRTGSKRLAVQLAVADLAGVPEELAAHVRSGRALPPSIMRALQVNEQVGEKLRGQRAYQLNSYDNLRDMTDVINGLRVPINPGDWWELDDMSINQPFWFEVPAGADRLSQRHGVQIGRQGLYCMDVCSGRWLGHQLIGRPRDAYRAEDILRFLRLLMGQYGKPRRGLRLERGIWESTRISGYELSDTDRLEATESDCPEVAAPERERLVAGLRDLGIEVVHVYKPGTKGFIEGGFRRLQEVMASRVDLANIGRTRGEMETATRGLIAVHAGRSHPGNRGFGHIEAVSEAIAWAETFLNAQTKQGRLHQGIPDERWVASATRAPLAGLSRDDLAVFLPERGEKQISSGHLALQREGVVYPFVSPELFAEVGNGYRVLAAFDPSEPTLGCAMWNAETSSTNRQGWRLGQFLGWAEFEPAAPQFGVDPEHTAQSLENRRRYHNYHRTAFRAIAAFGLGVDGRESTVRDGRGNVARSTSAVPVPAAPAVTSPGETEIRTTAEPRDPLVPLPAPRRRSGLEAPTQEQFTQRRGRTAGLLAALKTAAA